MTPESYQLKFDGYSLLLNEKLLVRGDQVITLSNRAFDLLVLFAENEGKVMLKRELLDKVWADTFVEEGNLAVAINSLRKALKTDDNKVYIETFPKRGYRFNAQVEKVLVKNNFKENEKQPDSLPSLSVNPEIPAASLPKSAKLNPFQIIKSKLAQRKWLLLALTITVLFFSFYTIAFPVKTQVNAMEQTAPNSQKLRIAILPFVDLRPSVDTKDLGRNLADSTMFELAKANDFAIISSIPIEKYYQKIPKPEEIRKEVDADFVLTGTFLKNGENAEIDSQLIEVKTGKVLMTNTESITNSELSVLKGEFTKRLVSKIKLHSNALSASLKKNK